MRNVEASFNESAALSQCIYVSLIISGLCTIIGFTVERTANLVLVSDYMCVLRGLLSHVALVPHQVAYTVGVVGSVTFTLAAIFVPKLLSIKEQGRASVQYVAAALLSVFVSVALRLTVLFWLVLVRRPVAGEPLRLKDTPSINRYPPRRPSVRTGSGRRIEVGGRPSGADRDKPLTDREKHITTHTSPESKEDKAQHNDPAATTPALKPATTPSDPAQAAAARSSGADPDAPHPHSPVVNLPRPRLAVNPLPPLRTSPSHVNASGSGADPVPPATPVIALAPID